MSLYKAAFEELKKNPFFFLTIVIILSSYLLTFLPGEWAVTSVIIQQKIHQWQFEQFNKIPS